MVKFHLIGVGGAGMSVVAQLLAAQGAQVSGSDQADSPRLQSLSEHGVTTFVGHDAAHVPEDAVVVVSTAVKDSNPELAVARARGQRVIHRSQALALAATGMEFVAVAGAHGKTTTSGMLAQALSHAGVDASFAVGGVVKGFGSGAHLGASNVFVAEADESDASFLNYSPRIAMVTNVEVDHLDYYGSKDAFEQAFVDFAGRIEPGGALVVCADDPGANKLGQAYAQAGGRVLTYGFHADSDATLRDPHLGECARATLSHNGSQWPLQLRVGGEHNLENAAGAFLVGVELGVEPAVMVRALNAFEGTGRRFDFRCEVDGKRLFDDYAHHPSEVEAVLKQARQVAGDGRVLVLFQPHLYSRTKNFCDRFAAALAHADVVVLTDIYGAREAPIEGVSAALISDQIPGASFVPDLHEAARDLALQAQPGDLCLTMGAGSVTEAGSTIEQVWLNQ